MQFEILRKKYWHPYMGTIDNLKMVQVPARVQPVSIIIRGESIIIWQKQPFRVCRAFHQVTEHSLHTQAIDQMLRNQSKRTPCYSEVKNCIFIFSSLYILCNETGCTLYFSCNDVRGFRILKENRAKSPSLPAFCLQKYPTDSLKNNVSFLQQMKYTLLLSP